MKTVNIVLIALVLECIMLMTAQRSSAALAFPGAEGFGAQTRGAYELYEKTGNPSDLPRIIHVTNLNDAGTGSFRDAVTASGPRIVVFDTGGIVTLSKKVDIITPYLTVAGQTAPGDGICLRGSSLRVIKSTHDIIVRGLRIRPTSISSIGSIPVDGRDAVTLGNDDNDTGKAPSTDIIFDHNSFSWSSDEMFTLWAGAERITVSNNILYQPSDFQDHQYGVLIGAGSKFVSYHHNILSHISARAPLIGGSNDYNILPGASHIEVINNGVYNSRRWGPTAIYREAGYTSGAQPQYIVYRNNFNKAGVDTNTDGSTYVLSAPAKYQVSSGAYLEDVSRLFMVGNLTPRRTDDDQDDWAVCGGATCNYSARYDQWPFEASGVTEREAEANFKWMLGMDGNIPNIGAYPRDIVDTISMEEAASGDRFFGTAGAYGPGPTNPTVTSYWRSNRSMFPAYASGSVLQDTDRDGMPDAWEKEHGLDAQSASDAHADRDSDGYSNIEEYVNSFFSPASEILPVLSRPTEFRLK